MHANPGKPNPEAEESLTETVNLVPIGKTASTYTTGLHWSGNRRDNLQFYQGWRLEGCIMQTGHD
jgi:hypothetical protein